VSPYAVLLPLGLFVSILILAVALPAQIVLLAVTLPFDRTRTVPGRFIRLVAVAISRTFPPWRLRVVGRWPGPGPYVVVSNHQSMLDVLLLSRLPHEMKWVAKESLFRVPWVGWMFTLAGDISVRRGDAESGSGALRKARWYLDHGMSVMIFPEGTRSRTGALQQFKLGAFRLALDAGVPVLPVAVSGTAAGLPSGGHRVRPCRGTAQVLEPVAAGSGGLDEPLLLRDEVRRRIAAALAS
jgi:1-acyl-sn-glycerol-3-phosphate acyltransferase